MIRFDITRNVEEAQKKLNKQHVRNVRRTSTTRASVSSATAAVALTIE